MDSFKYENKKHLNCDSIPKNYTEISGTPSLNTQVLGNYLLVG